MGRQEEINDAQSNEDEVTMVGYAEKVRNSPQVGHKGVFSTQVTPAPPSTLN